MGQVTPEKGLREFVTAAPIVLREKDNAHFVVIGADSAPDRDFVGEMADYAGRLGVAGNFTFTGFRADAERIQAIYDSLLSGAP